MIGTALLLVLAAQVELRSQREQVTAGEAVSVTVLTRDGAGKPLPEIPVVTVRGARLVRLEPGAPGTYTAVLQTAPSEAPSAALVHARVKGGSRFLSVPIAGRRILALTAAPRAAVTVQVAERSFGPFQADAAGAVRAQVTLPPGVRSATVQTVERRGARTEDEVELPAASFQRVMLAATDKAEASFERPLELSLFMVDEAARPLTRPSSVVATASAGQLSDWRFDRAEGSVRFLYRGGDKAEVTSEVAVALLGDPAQRDLLPVRTVAGSPARIEVLARPEQVVAGEGTNVELQGRLLDARGNLAAPAPIAFRAELGQVERRGPSTGVLRAPDFFEGRTELVVSAVAGEALGEQRVLLRSATASRAAVTAVKEKVKVGDPARLVVALDDRFGNPVDGVTLAVRADRGSVKEVKPLGGGKYEVAYAVRPLDGPGPLELEIRPEPGAVVATSRLDVLPHQPPWGMTLGLVGVLQSNLALSSGGGGRVEAGVRLGALPLELLLQLEGRVNRPISSPVEDGVERLSAVGVSGRLGLRYSMPLFSRAALFASGQLGLQFIRGTVELPQLDLSESATSVGGTYGVGLGLTWVLGPGRILLELQAQSARGRGLVRGNFGGVGAGLGYVLELGGGP